MSLVDVSSIVRSTIQPRSPGARAARQLIVAGELGFVSFMFSITDSGSRPFARDGRTLNRGGGRFAGAVYTFDTETLLPEPGTLVLVGSGAQGLPPIGGDVLFDGW